MRNYPYLVTIQATLRCNLTCPMCYREHLPPDVLADMNRQNMPMDRFEQLAAQILPYAKTVNLSVAGEPLLVPHLDQILTILGHYQCKLELFTNVTPLASDRLMDKILPHVGVLRASIDGATKETFELIREGADFEKVVYALERFGKLRKSLPPPIPAYGFHVVMQRDNIEELPDIVRLAGRVGADFVSADHIIVLSHSMKEQAVDPAGDAYHRAHEEACRIARELGLDIMIPAPAPKPRESTDSNQVPSKLKAKRVECPYLWNQVFVNFNGETVPCCHPEPPLFPGDGIDDFWSVWNGPEAQRIRTTYQTAKAHPSCSNCYLLKGDGTPVGEESEVYNLADFEENHR